MTARIELPMLFPVRSPFPPAARWRGEERGFVTMAPRGGYRPRRYVPRGPDWRVWALRAAIVAAVIFAAAAFALLPFAL